MVVVALMVAVVALVAAVVEVSAMYWTRFDAFV